MKKSRVIITFAVGVALFIGFTIGVFAAVPALVVAMPGDLVAASALPPEISGPVETIPITETPTTETPISTLPPTEAPPITDAPSTAPTATEVPVTDAPITDALTTAPIINTEIPVSENPATEAPTEVPTTAPVPTEPPSKIQFGEAPPNGEVDWNVPYVSGFDDETVQGGINLGIAMALEGKVARAAENPASTPDRPEMDLREAWIIGDVIGMRVDWTAYGSSGTAALYYDMRTGVTFDPIDLFGSQRNKLAAIQLHVEPQLTDDPAYGVAALDKLYYSVPDIWMDSSRVYFCYDAGALIDTPARIPIDMADIANFPLESDFSSALGAFADASFSNYEIIVAGH